MVFETSEVDTEFSPYACVDLGQQCGGYVDERDTSLEGGGAKPAHIDNYSAA